MSLRPRYFLHRDGQDHGPFSRTELEFLWSEGRASGGDFVRPEDGSQGTLLRELTSSEEEPLDDLPWEADPDVPASPDTDSDHTLVFGLEDEAGSAISEYRGSTPLQPVEERPQEQAMESHDWGKPTKEAAEFLYQGHPSLMVYGGRLFWVLLLAAAAVWLERYGNFWVAAAATTSGLLLLGVLLQRISCTYRITPTRIEVSHGLFMAHSREMALGDIRSIEIRRTGLAALFNIGTIEFASSGNDRIEIVFRKVRQPGKIKRLVHDLQDQANNY